MTFLKVKTQAGAWLWLILGHVAFSVGMIGIFVPLLPTTPFVLVAAFCYGKGSKRFEDWMINHPRFGPGIIMWRRHRSIPLKAKVVATLMIGISVTWVALLPHIPLVAKIAMFVTVGSVVVYIWSRPSAITMDHR